MLLENQDLWIVSLAETLSDRIHQAVSGWDRLNQWTVGQQLIRSSDSIAANIVEGCGRGQQRDALRFLLIARGSLDETQLWIKRAANRRLIRQENTRELQDSYTQLAKALNAFIAFRQSRLNFSLIKPNHRATKPPAIDS